MKKSKLFPIFLLSLVISNLSLVINPAFAQTASPSPTKKPSLWSEIRNQTREVRQEIRENFKEARTTIKEDREDMRQDIKNIRLTGTPGIDRKATVSATRLQFRKDRLTATYNAIKKNLTERFNLLDVTIKAKVQAKIDAQTSAGKNTTEAKAKLATYSTANYISHLATFDAQYQTILVSTDPKSMLKDLNNSAKTVRTDLNIMRQTLFDAFRLAVRAK
ncbi:hypothetical protein KBC75_05900 [Candidatus Shapirobacteria bacterium]|nr:hypothetical protein [Candidatus Shapirobacteria bacterium]